MTRSPSVRSQGIAPDLFTSPEREVTKMPRTLYVDIDISAGNIMTQFMDADGAALGRSLRFPNTQAGLDALLQAIRDPSKSTT